MTVPSWTPSQRAEIRFEHLARTNPRWPRTLPVRATREGQRGSLAPTERYCVVYQTRGAPPVIVSVVSSTDSVGVVAGVHRDGEP
jgi:hypothetical protein